MNKTKERWSSILWNEAFGFSLMIALSWLTELMRIPHYLFGEPFIPNWHRAMLRTGVILLIWGWVYLVTKKMLKRLHYLEDFLRTCSWCRKVCHHGEWMTVDEYFNSEFATRTTHGMCPTCSEKWGKQPAPAANPSSDTNAAPAREKNRDDDGGE